MIWHFFEIWLVLFAAFAFGSFLGALVYAGIARTPLGPAQGVVADAVGDIIDAVRSRLGTGSTWRRVVRRGAARTARDTDFGGDDQDFVDEEPRRPTLLQRAAQAARGALPKRQAAERADVEPEWDGDPEVALEDGDRSFLEESTGELAALPAAPDVIPMRPLGLPGPRNGIADDLQRIRGIGKRNEELLNSLGIYHFGQIAAWTPGEVRWVGAYLSFPERIERDDWVGQATVLGSGGETGYVKAERRKKREDEEA